jgi:hypothetical protein
MYYRHAILLALIKQCGGLLDKIRLQKLLFLFCNKQKKPAYTFVPYKFGCFSFQANADLLTLKKNNNVEEIESSWKLRDDINIESMLRDDDTLRLGNTIARFAPMDNGELIRYTYVNFPFFAINSTIAHDYLNDSERAAVTRLRQTDSSPNLFTIGYEGKSLEVFLTELIKNGIALLCDVRKNAFSMKYGFSKSTLANACENVGINYIHTPAFGIESVERKNLNKKEDYVRLFEKYSKTVLNETKKLQQNLWMQIQKAGRAALMCFEADPEMCHRSHCAMALIANANSNLPVIHL